MQSQPDSPSEHVSQFLVTLNQIWNERLTERVKALKQKHTTETRQLRRKIEQRIPYMEVLQKAYITRLRQDLHCSRQEVLKSKPSGQQGLLNLSLSTVESLSRQVVDLENERAVLKAKITELNEERQSVASVFKSGANWLGDQLVGLTTHFSDTVWKLANAFVDKAIRHARRDDFIPKLSEECQLFLDSVENDTRACKANIKRALMEAEFDPLGSSSNPSQPRAI